MILSDRDIADRLDIGDLEIGPVGDFELQLQPASFDLRLGEHFVWPDTDQELVLPIGKHGWIAPGQFILGHTIETVRIPNDLAARVEGRSSWGRRGLMVHLTAGFVDPGFQGQITLELYNASARSVRLAPGDRICQLSLYQMTSPAARPYGATRGSKYNGQTGATRALSDKR